MTKAANTAARISTPCPRSESWNTCAVPEKPVTIVTGFLGAGQTTLVRRLLTTPEGRNTAVIINEYGAVGIDNALPTALRVLSQWPVLGGLVCYVVSVGVWIVGLSRVDVSVAYPMLSLGYVVNAFAAWWLLGEAVGAMRSAGVLLILSLLAAFFVQARQQALLNRAEQGQDEYLVLNLFQLETEYLRLRERWRQAADDPGSAREQLQLRYDIFISRVALLQTDRAQRVLSESPEYGSALRALRDPGGSVSFGRGVADEASFAVDVALLGEADVVRLQRRADDLEARLAAVEDSWARKLERRLRAVPERVRTRG